MPADRTVALAARVIRALARLAPPWRRDEWRDEWLAELHFRASRLASHGRLTRGARLALLARAAGAAVHVLFLWKLHWGFDMLIEDVRYGLRVLLGRPTFTAVAIATLALGIGATTTMFSAVHAVLLKPLPYPSPDRLVRVYGIDTRQGQRKVGNLSVPDVDDFARRTRLFDAIGAHNYGGYFTVTGNGEPERVPRLLVNPGYFRVLGEQAALGRLFLDDDYRPTPPDFVVLSYGYWQRRFGGDPSVVGRSIGVSGTAATVIGVLPASFVHPDPTIEAPPDVFALLDPNEEVSSRSGRYVRAIGRLSPGVSLDQGASELDAVAAALAQAYPTSNTGRGVMTRALADAVAGDAGTPLLLLQAATLTILAIACVNLANLLLGASAGRAGEMSVRAALGAGKGRLVRQLLTEALLLASIGGAAGIGIAVWGTSALSAAAAGMLLPHQHLSLNPAVLLFAIGVTLAAGVTFGLLPAWHMAGRTAAALRESRRHTDGPGRARLGFALIAAEVALSVSLLIGAVLLVRSYRELTDVNPGFHARQVMSFQLAVTEAQFPEGTQAAFYERLYARLRAIPGVESVGATNILPLTNSYSCDGIQIAGRLVPKESEPCAEARSVSADYFRTMGIPVVRGRTFTDRDTATSPRVVVVNEAFAREFFGGEDPVGRRMVYSGRRQGDAREIVGVVGDVHHFDLGRAPVAEFYTPQPQPPSYHGMTIVMQSRAAASAIMPAARNAVRALAPEAPIYNARTVGDIVDASVSDARFRTVLLGLFAALAVLLAVVGTYGVIALVVSQRTQEMGIRVALGAGPRDIRSLVLSGGMRPVLAGLAAGLAAGYAIARAISGLLFNVTPADPATFASCAALILAAGLAATWLPARRACRVDPVIALRN